MSELRVFGAAKAYGPVTALTDAHLTAPSGTLTVVVGPSGCGKTTLLRCIAGFERLTRGEIYLADRPLAGPVTHVAAHRRGIAVVPQEGALFPHMSVNDNVSYGLSRAARTSGRVDEVLALVGLDGYGRRMPHQLSGGQQQRVALARALAPRPGLILLDEPFSALDAALRTQVRRDVADALRADRATAVLVTHDQDEALSIADQVAVMRDGVIVQTGRPDTVYQMPTDPWVAGFIGDAVLLPTTSAATGVLTALGRLAVADRPTPNRPAQDRPTQDRGAAMVMVRPEQIRLSTDPGGVPATVVAYDYHGHDSVVLLQLGDGTRIRARVAGPALPPDVGDLMHIHVDGDAHPFTEAR
jgi:iron(III) transport system ATP-binding protein